MNWSEETKEALHGWLGRGAAYKKHPIDNERFYIFLAHVWQDCGTLWDEATAREIMKHKARELHPEAEWSDSFIDSFVRERVSEGTNILEFLVTLKAKGALNELLPV